MVSKPKTKLGWAALVSIVTIGMYHLRRATRCQDPKSDACKNDIIRVLYAVALVVGFVAIPMTFANVYMTETLGLVAIALLVAWIGYGDRTARCTQNSTDIDCRVNLGVLLSLGASIAILAAIISYGRNPSAPLESWAKLLNDD